MDLLLKTSLRRKRIYRIRKKIHGTSERPRLCLHFSNLHIYAQLINDDAGVTLISVSSIDKDVRENKLHANTKGAKELGKRLAEKALGAGIQKVVFDRNGRRFHGTVKAFADTARATGLQF